MSEAKQVVVRSDKRFPLVRTSVQYRRDERGAIVPHGETFRQFFDYHARMTPEEAAFIVESDENHVATDAGRPMFWYPAGAPLMENAVNPKHPDKSLQPPLTLDQMQVTDPHQAEAARKVIAEAERQIAEQEAAAGVSAPPKPRGPGRPPRATAQSNSPAAPGV